MGPNWKFPFFILKHSISSSLSLVKEWANMCTAYSLNYCLLAWAGQLLVGPELIAIGWSRANSHWEKAHKTSSPAAQAQQQLQTLPCPL